jgi:DNA-directed RNA polymerase specialized sigma24 family protein
MRQKQDAVDHDAEFREFVRYRGTPLHQSAYLLCGDWHLAHDVVQDTLVKAYQHWSRVRHADNPEAYVRRILINEVRGRWRRWAPTSRGALPPDQDSAADIAGRFKQSLSTDEEQIVGYGEYQGHQVTKLASHDHGQYS